MPLITYDLIKITLINILEFESNSPKIIGKRYRTNFLILLI